ncbi:hypothetical protein FACS1894130_11390 [Spirochaetia bacterium]|nr:hypothetical protein FACS1894130_11390 [Spirochaetia bacterium]
MKKAAVLVGVLVLVCGVLFAQTASDFDMESVTYRGAFRNWESFAEFARTNIDEVKNVYIFTGDNLRVT